MTINLLAVVMDGGYFNKLNYLKRIKIFRYSPFSQKCYKLFTDKIGWTVAEYKCLFMGAHHISIHDLNDNTFVSGT